jgi:hypothetical protein
MTKLKQQLHAGTKFKQSQTGAKISQIPLGRNKTISSPGKLIINGKVVEGEVLSRNTIIAVNAAAAKIPKKWRRFIAYKEKVKVGGSLAWRANNPGSLRDADTKIGSVPGATGYFAVFANIDEGRAAQKNLYMNRYGAMKVRTAINKLTPPCENDTAKYLADLKEAGVELDKSVASQIDILMEAIKTNEGLIKGIEVPRMP